MSDSPDPGRAPVCSPRLLLERGLHDSCATWHARWDRPGAPAGPCHTQSVLACRDGEAVNRSIPYVTTGTDANGRAQSARNAIILIGDGMGAAHRFAGQLLLAGRGGRLAMDRLPILGQMATLSADPVSFVTDSAAAATAIATGV